MNENELKRYKFGIENLDWLIEFYKKYYRPESEDIVNEYKTRLIKWTELIN